jgi:hypothetical protein
MLRGAIVLGRVFANGGRISRLYSRFHLREVQFVRYRGGGGGRGLGCTVVGFPPPAVPHKLEKCCIGNQDVDPILLDATAESSERVA